MRLQHVQQSRPSWYDRGATEIGASYQTGATAPHAITSRFAYTVPAGKSAMLEVGVANAIRVTAAGAVAAVSAFIRVLLGGVTTVYSPFTFVFNNAVGAGDSQCSALQMVLTAGTTVTGFTEDLSTGGTVGYVLAFKATEFDA